LVDGLPIEDQEVPGKHSRETVSLLSSTNDEVVERMTTNSLSPVRAFVLLLALSVHMVFEGLAIGMQRNAAEVVCSIQNSLFI